MGLPTGEDFVGYGCGLAIIGFFVYLLITKPHGVLIGALIFGGMTVVCGVCMGAWHGLIWLTHSEKKWAKSTVEFTTGLCVVVLLLAAAYFSLDGMLRLYRREFVWFAILSSCLGYLMLYWLAKHGQK